MRLLLCVLLWLALPASAYDPLAVSGARPQVIDLTVNGSRACPVRVYLPPGNTTCPVVLFSHGLGGSREGSAYLGEHWAGRGYAAVFLQHPGSDTSVWENLPPDQRLAALRRAANAENLLLRIADVKDALDYLSTCSLASRLDLSRVGMSGHSFGAVTTQAVSGQCLTGRGPIATDPRIKAAVAFSPSSPRRGDPRQAFGEVKIPWMLITGTQDVAPIGDQDVAARLTVFPALPPGGKYELVLKGAKHSAFTDRPEVRNPNHHRVVLAVTTAFWDAWLRGDQEARTWLDGDGPTGLLEPGDRWQKK